MQFVRNFMLFQTVKKNNNRLRLNNVRAKNERGSHFFPNLNIILTLINAELLK